MVCGLWSEDQDLTLAGCSCLWFWALNLIFVVYLLLTIDCGLCAMACDLPIPSPGHRLLNNWSSSKRLRWHFLHVTCYLLLSNQPRYFTDRIGKLLQTIDSFCIVNCLFAFFKLKYTVCFETVYGFWIATCTMFFMKIITSFVFLSLAYRKRTTEDNGSIVS